MGAARLGDDVDAIRLLFFPFAAVPVEAHMNAACVADYWSAVAGDGCRVRQESWEKLPSFWDLAPWEKLRAQFSSFSQDVSQSLAG